LVKHNREDLMNAKRNGKFALLLVLALVLASVPAALASAAEGDGSGSDREPGYTYTWVDAYGNMGAPWLSVPAAQVSGAEGDRAGGVRESGYIYTWVDAYGKMGAPWLSVSAGSSNRSLVRAKSTLSGDDLYDEAAGGRPRLSVAGFVASSGSSQDSNSAIPCVLSADELKARRAWAVEGGFSGDDAYDSAAGGTPELSLLPFAEDLTFVAACDVTWLGS
jgi:hypothetical protein